MSDGISWANEQDLRIQFETITAAYIGFADFVRNLALSTGYRTPENVSEPIELEQFMLWLAKRGDDTFPVGLRVEAARGFTYPVHYRQQTMPKGRKGRVIAREVVKVLVDFGQFKHVWVSPKEIQPLDTNPVLPDNSP